MYINNSWPDGPGNTSIKFFSHRIQTFCLLQNMGCLRTATVLGLTLASWLIILSTRDLQVKLSPRALMVDRMIIDYFYAPSALSHHNCCS